MRWPFQLDFIGDPNRRDNIEWHSDVSCTPLDLSACLQLSKDENKQYKSLLQKSRRQIRQFKDEERPTVADLSYQYKLKQYKEWKALGYDTRLFEQNYQPIKMVFRTAELSANHLLFFDKDRGITVNELLTHATDYDGDFLADPIEGVSTESDGSRSCVFRAIFYANQNKKGQLPCIISYSQGGIEYRLKRPDISVDKNYRNFDKKAPDVISYCQAALERSKKKNDPCFNTIFRYPVLEDSNHLFLAVLMFIQNNPEDYKGRIILYVVPTKERLESIRSMDHSCFESININSYGKEQGRKGEEPTVLVSEYKLLVTPVIPIDTSLLVTEGRFYTALMKSRRYQFKDLEGILKKEQISFLKDWFERHNFIDRNFISHLIDTKSEPIKILKDLKGKLSYSHLTTNSVSQKGREFARQLTRLLKPNGTLLFTVMKNDLIFHNTEGMGLEKNLLSYCIQQKIPTICFDSYANERIYQTVFFRYANGDKTCFKYIDIDTQLHTVNTQCCSKIFSESLMIGRGYSSKSTMKGVITVVNRAASSIFEVYEGKTVLVTYEALVKKKGFTNKLSPLISLLSFEDIPNSLFDEKTHLIILGRYQPNSSEVVSYVTTLFRGTEMYSNLEDYSDPRSPYQRECLKKSASDFELQDAHYVGTGNKNSKGTARYFSNDTFNLALSLVREEKSLQAIRCLSKGGKFPTKQVLILDSLALDIYIHHTFSWTLLNPKSAQLAMIHFFEKHNGIFIRSPTWLHKLEPSRSVQQWKSGMRELDKLVENRFILPLSLTHYRCGENGETYFSNYVPIKLDKMLHLGDDKHELKSQLNKKVIKRNTAVVCFYDSQRQDEKSVAKWLKYYLRRDYIQSDAKNIKQSESERILSETYALSSY